MLYLNYNRFIYVSYAAEFYLFNHKARNDARVIPDMAALPTTHLIPPSDATQPTAVLLQLGTFSPITNAHLRLLGTHTDLPDPATSLTP